MIQNRRAGALGAAARGILAIGASVFLAGCISMAEFRKLEYEVNKLKIGGAQAPSDGVADLRAEVEALRAEVAGLGGRVEVAEHETRRALEEAETARLAQVNQTMRAEHVTSGCACRVYGREGSSLGFFD